HPRRPERPGRSDCPLGESPRRRSAVRDLLLEPYLTPLGPAGSTVGRARIVRPRGECWLGGVGRSHDAHPLDRDGHGLSVQLLGQGPAVRGPTIPSADAPTSFTAATFRFFRGLARHNAKPWFEAHRADYERDVRAPMQALIEEMDVRLARLAPEITGDSKRSMFRIYRDIRFSKDNHPTRRTLRAGFVTGMRTPESGATRKGAARGFTCALRPAVRSSVPASGCLRARS